MCQKGAFPIYNNFISITIRNIASLSKSQTKVKLMHRYLKLLLSVMCIWANVHGSAPEKGNSFFRGFNRTYIQRYVPSSKTVTFGLIGLYSATVITQLYFNHKLSLINDQLAEKNQKIAEMNQKIYEANEETAVIYQKIAANNSLIAGQLNNAKK